MFQRVHVYALELHRRLTALETSFQSVVESGGLSKQSEKRMATLEHGLRQTNLSLQEDVARLTGALDVVRGQVVGMRGGRPRNAELEADRQALQLGQRVIQAMATPEGRAQLLLELQGAPAAPPSPIGAPPVNPRNGA